MSHPLPNFVGVLVLGFLLTGCAAETALPAPPVREALGGQAELPYSEAVRYGDTYYFSGKVGATDSTRVMVEGRTAAEARNVLEAFRGALERNGLRFEDVVNATVYLTNIDTFAEMNAVYREYFATEPPARTTVAVSGLPGGAAIEIALVAVSGSASGGGAAGVPR
jgi:2-iminobutanoate/2-iminopropanoate deaminase